MAATTFLGNTISTTNGTAGSVKTVVATPAASDCVVIVSVATGSTAVNAPTDNNSDGLGTYSLAATCLKASSADILQAWVRNALVGSATSTTFSYGAGVTSGGGLGVYKLTGMTRFGVAAVRQAAIQSNVAAATPAPVFGAAVLTGNPVLGFMFNDANPATMTPRTGFTEDLDIGYALPAAGVETMHIDSGETGTTMTWGSASSAGFGAIVIEMDTSTATTDTLLGQSCL